MSSAEQAQSTFEEQQVRDPLSLYRKPPDVLIPDGFPADALDIMQQRQYGNVVVSFTRGQPQSD